jgi:hypothetical protein
MALQNKISKFKKRPILTGIILMSGLVIMLLSASGHAYAASPTSGCFTDLNGDKAGTCPTPAAAKAASPEIDDNTGTLVDTSKYCYLVATDTETGNPNYTLVSCSSIDVSSTSVTANSCGGPGQAVNTSIDLGCTHQGNPIADLLFAIIRLLSDGVGIMVVASVIVGGIQFSVSRGDPNATAAAIGRIRTSLIALLIYIFAYAILNYVIPGGFLK